MQKPSRPTDLASKAGISIAYASEILGDKRVPSRALAIHIFRCTDWKHASIEALTDEQIALFEQVEPWVAPADKAAAA